MAGPRASGTLKKVEGASERAGRRIGDSSWHRPWRRRRAGNMEYVPAADNAVVAENKIRGYLLSTEHPFGRFKSQFFLEFGFRLDAWMEMQASLLRHVRENRVVDSEVTEFGTKYVVEGPLVSPDGRNPGVRTVWFIETEEQRPRFVTAYPI
jgi:hypothetical protein